MFWRVVVLLLVFTNIAFARPDIEPVLSYYLYYQANSPEGNESRLDRIVQVFDEDPSPLSKKIEELDAYFKKVFTEAGPQDIQLLTEKSVAIVLRLQKHIRKQAYSALTENAGTNFQVSSALSIGLLGLYFSTTSVDPAEVSSYFLGTLGALSLTAAIGFSVTYKQQSKFAAEREAPIRKLLENVKCQMILDNHTPDAQNLAP